ncbi:MAG: hypothetical protein JRG71_07730 [Deltaproteobacteria bacterium]|nr:hypothetical protein [Deltaproteobacteria bacterium]
MKKVIITAALPERLKVVGFLLHLAGWEVKSFDVLPDAVNYFENAARNEDFYDLFLVVDYFSLGKNKSERLSGTHYLDTINSLKKPVKLVVAGKEINESEQQEIIYQFNDTIDFCSSELLINYIETFYSRMSCNNIIE